MNSTEQRHRVELRPRLNRAVRVYAGIWQSWRRAQRELPSLRWLAAASLITVAVAAALAARQGVTLLEACVDAMIVCLFALEIPFILYLLLKLHRRHRSEALLDGKRLTDLVRKTLRREMAIAEARKVAEGHSVLLLLEPGASRSESWHMPERQHDGKRDGWQDAAALGLPATRLEPPDA
jgi:hypothetical protein